MKMIRAVMLVASVALGSVVATSTALASETFPTVREERADLQAWKIESSRVEPAPAPAPAPPPAPEPAPAPEPEPIVAEAASPPVLVEPSGSCGGWSDTIAAHFGEQAATACRVMLCESGGNPSAQNPSGASGLFQIMPGWADEYQSVTGVPYYDGRFDGPANIQFAAWLASTGGWQHWACY